MSRRPANRRRNRQVARATGPRIVPVPPCQRCGWKRTWSNQTLAEAMAAREAARHGKPFRAYECPHGSGWHLTSQPDRNAP